jgi:hypothetical protein
MNAPVVATANGVVESWASRLRRHLETPLTTFTHPG